MTGNNPDVIVVGSGAAGVNAAYPLVQAGRSVVMLDVGVTDDRYEGLIPDAPFDTIRRTDVTQHRYFLGDDFEGIPLGQLGAGPQVTPPRQFTMRHAQSWTPYAARDFEAVESLATGGLTNAWGAVNYPYLDRELERSGLKPADLRPHYEIVAKRIGVSGANDDLAAVRGPLEALQQPLRLDANAAHVLSQYAERSDSMRREGLHIGRSMMAVLTESRNGRRAQAYHGMDFWSNHGGSVYRAPIGLRELEAYANFSYQPGRLVQSFAENGPDSVSVTSRLVSGGETETITARRLLMAAGALGTTRIVLRSLSILDTPVPLTCNRHSYIPSLLPGRLGKPQVERFHSLAQLSFMFDPTGDREHLVQGQLYSYGTLMLFRLLKESPLPGREGLRVMRDLSPALAIWVVQHEDEPGPEKQCRLRKLGPDDELEIVYRPSAAQEDAEDRHERRIAALLGKVGCRALKRVHPIHGSSVHYAGMFPPDENDKPLTTEPSGRLRGTRNVYLADGSVLRYLPAKGLTFTMMANANRIGTGVRDGL